VNVFLAEEQVKRLLPLPKVSSCALSDRTSEPLSEPLVKEVSSLVLGELVGPKAHHSSFDDDQLM